MSGLLQKGVELTAEEKRALLADLLRESGAPEKRAHLVRAATIVVS